MFDFLDEFLRDLERGKRLPLTHYLARYPGHEEAVAGEYLAELQRAQPAPPPRASESDDGKAGADPERVGPYRLLRELGRGGQGAVWLAEDTRIARHVALKLLPAEFAALSTERRRRLQREAEVIARLDHPCLCAVLEASIDGERPYIAMRYVQGATLAEWIARERELRKAAQDGAAPNPTARPIMRMAPRSALDQARLLSFFERAARALHAAHEAGVVHRDVKPQNIMVAQNGDPVVLDFGQARDETSDSFELTRSGDVLGTPAYMSPEQILGRREGIDRRTDVWSLGASLYEALTLARPFEGGSVPALFMAIGQAPLADPRSHNPALGADLCLVVATALEKEPQRRYASALEFAEDLRRVREYEPVRARPPSAARLFQLWVQRHPALAFSTLGSIVALSIGLASSLYLLREVNQALDVAVGRHLSQRTGELLEEDPAAALALGIEAAALTETFETRAAMLLALQACHLQRVIVGDAPAKRTLDCALSEDGTRAALAFDDGHVAVCTLEAGPAPVIIRGAGAEARAVRFDADGAHVAFVAADGMVRVARSSDGEILCKTALADPQARAVEFLDGGLRCFALSDHGALAADSRNGSRLWHWELPTSSEPRAAADAAVHAAAGRALVWTHEKPELSSSGRAWLIDTESGELVRELQAPAAFRCAEFRPDGAVFATGSSDGTVSLWRARDGELERSYEGFTAVRTLRFSPDGHRMLTLQDEGRSTRGWLWYLDTGAKIPLQHSAGTRIAHGGFSPDGKRIATVGSDMVVRLWNSSDAREERSFKGLFLPLAIHWTPDGRSLVTRANDHRVQIWYAGELPDVFELRAGSARVRAAHFSPDGEQVLTASDDGQARLWSAPSRARAARDPHAPRPAELLFALAHRASVNEAQHSPDGTRIATASDDGSARLWDAKDGRELALLLAGQAELDELVWDADGARLAVRSRAGRAWICELAGGSAHALDSAAAITAMVWLPGLARLATGHADNALRIWGAKGGAALEERAWVPRETTHAPGAVAIAARADGGGGAEVALACADGRARFFAIGERVPPRKDLVLFLPQSIAFNAVGTRLFVCGVEGVGALRLQDLQSDNPIFQSVFHTGDLTGGSFSPDGRWLITTAESGGAYVRDARDGSHYVHFRGPGGACFAGAISPGEGEARALVATEDGSVWVWPLDPLPAAVARRPRPLTEWEQQREQRVALPLPYEPRR